MVALSGLDKVRPRTSRVRPSAAAGQRTGSIHPAESFVPAKTFREKKILPTSSGSALRKQNHSISFSSHRCQTPGTEDSASPTTTPDASSAHFTFNKKESREQDSLLLTNYIFHIGSSSAKP